MNTLMFLDIYYHRIVFVKKRSILIISILIVLTLFSGCAITKKVNTPENIKVYNGLNIVFLGYDFSKYNFKTSTQYPSYIDIHFQCSYKNSENKLILKKCFNIQNKHKGAEAYKMNFGEYSILSLTYTIKIGEIITEGRCYRENGKISCTDEKIEDITTSTIIIMNDIKKSFTVSKDSAPYVGRIVLEMKDGDPILYLKKSSNDKNSKQFEEDILLIKGTKMRNALKQHINY